MIIRKNIKKSHKVTAICDRVLQYSKDIKVAHQTTKMHKKCHLFFFFIYSYNTPIILTNKIIK